MFLRDRLGASCKDKPFSTHHYLTLEGKTEREKRVSAHAKPISEVVKDFEQSLENLRPSTKRVYMAGARAAFRAASLELWQSPSTTDLLV